MLHLVSSSSSLEESSLTSVTVRDYVEALPDSVSTNLVDLVANAANSTDDLTSGAQDKKQKKTVYYPEVGACAQPYPHVLKSPTY